MAELTSAWTVVGLQAFNRGPNANKVFFVELLYEKSKDVYQRLGITRFPHLYYWKPTISVAPGRAIKIPKGSDVSGTRGAGPSRCSPQGFLGGGEGWLLCGQDGGGSC